MGAIITKVIYGITISLYGQNQNNKQRSPKIQKNVNDSCNSINSFSSDDYVIFGSDLNYQI
jgi:hypothetical protein